MASIQSNPYGVGISTKGKHLRTLKNPSYRAWQQMLQRCYSEISKINQPTYDNCYVCDEWLHYQTFADWFDEQRGSDLGWELDKDLLASRQGLQVKYYSPNTCILLPSYINRTLVEKTKKDSGLPPGVHHNTKKTAFVARYRNIEGTNTHIGTFDTVKAAAIAYKQKKQEVLTYLADKYKLCLDTKAYSILTNYYLEI